MPAKIVVVTGIFKAIDQPVTLILPSDATELALRVKTNPPEDIDPSIELVFLDVVGPVGATFNRTFELNPDGEPLPETFVKYVATIPFGPLKTIVHMIEVSS
jgi:hypothetical protein